MIVIAPQICAVSCSTLLKQYVQNRVVLTPRNSNQSHIGYGRPALVYLPALKELELAMRYTRGDPVAVVEHPVYSCARWADEIGAVNLVEHRIHATQRSMQHQKLLE